MRQFGSIAKPLYALLKKGNYVWTIASQQACDSFKKALVSTPVLALPNFTKTFIVEIDASNEAIGVVLMEEGYAIAYINKTLALTNMLLSAYERELLAIQFAVKQ